MSLYGLPKTHTLVILELLCLSSLVAELAYTSVEFGPLSQAQMPGFSPTCAPSPRAGATVPEARVPADGRVLWCQGASVRLRSFACGSMPGQGRDICSDQDENLTTLKGHLH